MRKAHAEHNEKACDFLYNNGNFHDWVVTTAFYSAIHFARYKIFPLEKYDPQEGKVIKYRSLDNYVNTHSSASKFKKHKELSKLVNEHIPQITGRYRALFDMCHTARYHDYNVTTSKAKLAREHLQEIKKECLK